MAKEIECPGENLETLILYGDQIRAYNSFSGELDPKKFDEKIVDYYNLGRKLAKEFPKSDLGRGLFDSLKVHVENCEECSKNIAKLKEKYQNSEEAAKLELQSMENLAYCGILN